MALTEAGDITMEYYVEGGGPPLLLIMGFGGQASSWGEPFLAELRPHFTVIRFSNRGTGQSDRPDVQPTVRTMADDAARLLEAIGIERAHVMGISMGGMIAQELAINHPQGVAGLVLGCTSCGLGHAHHAKPEVVALLAPAPGLSREEQIRKAWPAMCAPAFLESGAAFLEEMLQSSLVYPTPIDTLMKQMVAVQGFDARERLSQITAAALVVHGDADELMPLAHGELLHRLLPGSELRVLPGAGHMFFWEQPRESAKVVVEFLYGVPAGT